MKEQKELKSKSRSSLKSAPGDYYYQLAKNTQLKLKKVNFFLTIIGMVVMASQLIFAIVTWIREQNLFRPDVEKIFKQYYFLNMLGNIFFTKRWFYLIRKKQASHCMNSVCAMTMLILFGVVFLASDPNSSDEVGVEFIMVVVATDVFIIVVSVRNSQAITIMICKIVVYKHFNTDELVSSFMTVQSKKYLKILPISEDMEGEYMQFKQEEEFRKKQARILQERKANAENEDQD